VARATRHILSTNYFLHFLEKQITNISSITNEYIDQEQKKRDAFANQCMKMSKRYGILHTMTYDKDTFCIRIDGPNIGQTWNLRNPYKECHGTYGKAREGILKKYVLGIKESITASDVLKAPFDKVRGRLRPLVRSKILTDNERYEFKGDNLSEFRATPRKSFSSDANILLAIDGRHGIEVVLQHHLDAWGVAFDDALDIAIKNLTATSRVRFEKSWAGFFQGGWKDYYDSSRLLLPNLFSEHGPFDDPVIMIPASDAIYIADKADIASQLHMLDAVQWHVDTSLKIVSTQMYHFVDGKPTEYKPDDKQLTFKLAEIYKPLFQSYAHQQKKVVEDHLIENGNWAYIMSPIITQSKEKNEIATVCCWANDMESIFTEADIIAVTRVARTDDGGAHVHSDPVLMWNEVIEKYGHLLQKMDGFPNLYRAAPFSGHQGSMAQAA
jgi:hypothetical protein